MKHAGLQTLHTLAPLLVRLRLLPGLVEKKPGVFYVKSKAFLHFHEDAAGIFADVRLAGDAFERFAVVRGAEQDALLAAVAQNRALSDKSLGRVLREAPNQLQRQ